MTTPQIVERQNFVRRRWLEWRTNPLLIDWLAVAQSGKSPDRVRAWCDMHARLACHEHGALLASDAAWAEVELQLSHSPLWLITNWKEPNAATAKLFTTRYYRLKKNSAGKLVASPSSVITAAINRVDTGELYEWLGVLGGHRPS